MNKVLIVDPAKCSGCCACAVACSTMKEGEVNLTKSRIKPVRFESDEVWFHYPGVCLQCEVPHCALVCPTNALQKNLDTGLVELTKEMCVGCKLCLVACPFGAVTMVGNVATKCDLCDGDPACVKLCFYDALKYGEIADMGAGKRVVVAEKMKDAHLGSVEIPSP